jgi:protein SCO1/2
MKNRAALFFLLLSYSCFASVQDVRFEQKVGSQMPATVQVIDEHGRAAPLETFFGDKPLILSFVYYGCPNLCTLVLNGLVGAMNESGLKAGKDVNLLSISIDPNEKPSLSLAKKRTYLARLEQTGDDNAAWHFLTASASNIQTLTQAAGFHFKYDKLTQEFNHPSGLLILSPKGAITRYFFGIQFNPEDLKTAVKDAAQGKTYKTLTEVILNCFHYSPQTGKYGSLIIRILQGVSLVTVLALIALLLRLALVPKKVLHG